jgi:hypothetical protein
MGLKPLPDAYCPQPSSTRKCETQDESVMKQVMPPCMQLLPPYGRSEKGKKNLNDSFWLALGANEECTYGCSFRKTHSPTSNTLLVLPLWAWNFMRAATLCRCSLIKALATFLSCNHYSNPADAAVVGTNNAKCLGVYQTWPQMVIDQWQCENLCCTRTGPKAEIATSS